MDFGLITQESHAFRRVKDKQDIDFCQLSCLFFLQFLSLVKIIRLFASFFLLM